MRNLASQYAVARYEQSVCEDFLDEAGYDAASAWSPARGPPRETAPRSTWHG